jgi:acyl carrier protein
MDDFFPLIEFVRTELVREKKYDQVGINENLITSGVIDSLGIMKLILFLEEKYSVKITDEDLTPENFESIQSVFSLVKKGLSRKND